MTAGTDTVPASTGGTLPSRTAMDVVPTDAMQVLSCATGQANRSGPAGRGARALVGTARVSGQHRRRDARSQIRGDASRTLAVKRTTHLSTASAPPNRVQIRARSSSQVRASRNRPPLSKSTFAHATPNQDGYNQKRAERAMAPISPPPQTSRPSNRVVQPVLALADSSMSATLPWSTLTHSGCHAAERALLHLGRQQRTRDAGYCGGASFTTRESGSRQRWT